MDISAVLLQASDGVDNNSNNNDNSNKNNDRNLSNSSDHHQPKRLLSLKDIHDDSSISIAIFQPAHTHTHSHVHDASSHTHNVIKGSNGDGDDDMEDTDDEERESVSVMSTTPALGDADQDQDMDVDNEEGKIKKEVARIAFVGCNDSHDEWVDLCGDRMAPINLKSGGYRGDGSNLQREDVMYISAPITRTLLSTVYKTETWTVSSSFPVLLYSPYLLATVEQFCRCGGIKFLLDHMNTSTNLSFSLHLMTILGNLHGVFSMSALERICEPFRIFYLRTITNLNQQDLRELPLPVLKNALLAIERFAESTWGRGSPAAGEVEHIYLNIANQCISCPYLNKRLGGLDILLDLIRRTQMAKLFPTGIRRERNVMSGSVENISYYIVPITRVLTSSDLAKIISKDFLVYRFFIGEEAHSSLMARAPDLIRLLASEGLLDHNIMSTIWTAAIDKREPMALEVMFKIVPVMPMDVMMNLLTTIRKFTAGNMILSGDIWNGLVGIVSAMATRTRDLLIFSTSILEEESKPMSISVDGSQSQSKIGGVEEEKTSSSSSSQLKEQLSYKEYLQLHEQSCQQLWDWAVDGSVVHDTIAVKASAQLDSVIVSLGFDAARTPKSSDLWKRHWLRTNAILNTALVSLRASVSVQQAIGVIQSVMLSWPHSNSINDKISCQSCQDEILEGNGMGRFSEWNEIVLPFALPDRSHVVEYYESSCNVIDATTAAIVNLKECYLSLVQDIVSTTTTATSELQSTLVKTVIGGSRMGYIDLLKRCLSFIHSFIRSSDALSLSQGTVATIWTAVMQARVCSREEVDAVCFFISRLVQRMTSTSSTGDVPMPSKVPQGMATATPASSSSVPDSFTKDNETDATKYGAVRSSLLSRLQSRSSVCSVDVVQWTFNTLLCDNSFIRGPTFSSEAFKCIEKLFRWLNARIGLLRETAVVAQNEPPYTFQLVADPSSLIGLAVFSEIIMSCSVDDVAFQAVQLLLALPQRLSPTLVREGHILRLRQMLLSKCMDDVRDLEWQYVEGNNYKRKGTPRAVKRLLMLLSALLDESASDARGRVKPHAQKYIGKPVYFWLKFSNKAYRYKDTVVTLNSTDTTDDLIAAIVKLSERNISDLKVFRGGKQIGNAADKGKSFAELGWTSSEGTSEVILIADKSGTNNTTATASPTATTTTTSSTSLSSSSYISTENAIPLEKRHEDDREGNDLSALPSVILSYTGDYFGLLMELCEHAPTPDLCDELWSLLGRLPTSPAMLQQWLDLDKDHNMNMNMNIDQGVGEVSEEEEEEEEVVITDNSDNNNNETVGGVGSGRSTCQRVRQLLLGGNVNVNVNVNVSGMDTETGTGTGIALITSVNCSLPRLLYNLQIVEMLLHPLHYKSSSSNSNNKEDSNIQIERSGRWVSSFLRHGGASAIYEAFDFLAFHLQSFISCFINNNTSDDTSSSSSSLSCKPGVTPVLLVNAIEILSKMLRSVLLWSALNCSDTSTLGKERRLPSVLAFLRAIHNNTPSSSLSSPSSQHTTMNDAAAKENNISYSSGHGHGYASLQSSNGSGVAGALEKILELEWGSLLFKFGSSSDAGGGGIYFPPIDSLMQSSLLGMMTLLRKLSGLPVPVVVVTVKVKDLNIKGFIGSNDVFSALILRILTDIMTSWYLLVATKPALLCYISSPSNNLMKTTTITTTTIVSDAMVSKAGTDGLFLSKRGEINSTVLLRSMLLNLNDARYELSSPNNLLLSDTPLSVRIAKWFSDALFTLMYINNQTETADTVILRKENISKDDEDEDNEEEEDDEDEEVFFISCRKAILLTAIDIRPQLNSLPFVTLMLDYNSNSNSNSSIQETEEQPLFSLAIRLLNQHDSIYTFNMEHRMSSCLMIMGDLNATWDRLATHLTSLKQDTKALSPRSVWTGYQLSCPQDAVMGCLGLLKAICMSSSDLMNILIAQGFPDILLKKCLGIEIDHNINNNNSDNGDDDDVVRNAYSLLLAFTCHNVDCARRVETVLADVHDTIPSPTDAWNFRPDKDLRSPLGYMGLRNLGSTCYMNSLLQVLFMIPEIRYGILDAPIDRFVSEETMRNNLLAQLQKLFLFLLLGSRKAYLPEDWAYAFKDDTGLHPVNVLQQQDANEFLQLLCERLEKQQQNQQQQHQNNNHNHNNNLSTISENNVTEGKEGIDEEKDHSLLPQNGVNNDDYGSSSNVKGSSSSSSSSNASTIPNLPQTLFQRTLGGRLCNQIIREGDTMDNIREREEQYVCISLDVKGTGSLENSLTKFVAGEQIPNFEWEEGQSRVNIMKRQCLLDVSDTVIFHLKRFELNFDTFLREKLNDEFTFPPHINLFQYTREGLMRDSSADSSSKSPPLIHHSDIEKYSYELGGVIVHTGTTNSGHYYAYIRESEVDAGSKLEHERRWIEFNDGEVRPFDESRIPMECFGGFTAVHDYVSSSQSIKTTQGIPNEKNAYMLIYHKTPSSSSSSSSSVRSRTGTEMEMGMGFGSGALTFPYSKLQNLPDSKIIRGDSRLLWKSIRVFGQPHMRFLVNFMSGVLGRSEELDKENLCPSFERFFTVIIRLLSRSVHTGLYEEACNLLKIHLDVIVTNSTGRALTQGDGDGDGDGDVDVTDDMDDMDDDVKAAIRLSLGQSPTLTPIPSTDNRDSKHNIQQQQLQQQQQLPTTGSTSSAEETLRFVFRKLLRDFSITTTLLFAPDKTVRMSTASLLLQVLSEAINMVNKDVSSWIPVNELNSSTYHMDNNDDNNNKTAATASTFTMARVVPVMNPEPEVVEGDGGEGHEESKMDETDIKDIEINENDSHNGIATISGGGGGGVGIESEMAQFLVDISSGKTFQLIAENWRRSDAITWLLRELCKMHWSVRIFLVNRGLIAEIVDLFLGDFSPACGVLYARDTKKRAPSSFDAIIPEINMSSNHTMKNIPDWTCLLDALALLTRSCRNESMLISNKKPPTLLFTDSAVVVPIMDEWSTKSIRSKTLFSTAVRQERYVNAINDIIAHQSYEWMEFSDHVSEMLFDALSVSTTETTAQIFRVMKSFLSIDDSLRIHRAHLFGGPNGIIDLISQSQLQNPRFVCVCIRSMLALINQVPSVKSVLGTPTSKIEVWASWMLKFCYQFLEKCKKDTLSQLSGTFINPFDMVVDGVVVAPKGPYLLVFGDSDTEHELTWEERADSTFRRLQEVLTSMGAVPGELIPADTFIDTDEGRDGAMGGANKGMGITDIGNGNVNGLTPDYPMTDEEYAKYLQNQEDLSMFPQSF
eukprot:gene1788-3471_t